MPDAVPLGVELRSNTTVSVELSALRKHMAIFAGTGSGKTVLIRRLVEECALRGVSSIVLDPTTICRASAPPGRTPPPGGDRPTIAALPTTSRTPRS